MTRITYHVSRITIAKKIFSHYHKAIDKVIERACKTVQCSKGTAMSIIFIGDSKMKELNRKYRGKDKTTNVLAFPASSQFTVHSSQFDLGDVFISLPEAKREAKKYGWTLRYEITRLALHGFLHLLEYDHVKDKEAKVMERIEKRVLKRL